MYLNRGQSLVEFGIIFALIVVVSVIALTLLGDNVKTMFKKSTTKVEGYKPFNWGSTASDSSIVVATTTTGTTSVEPTSNASTVSTFDVAGYEVSELADGSYAFAVGSQNVVISNDALNNMNTVIESTGTHGLPMLVDQIAYMIKEHEEEYPEGVPLEINFGSSTRQYGDYNDDGSIDDIETVRKGEADVNLVSIKVGDHVKIFEHDQSCDYTSGQSCGQYTLEGYIDKNNVLKASIKSEQDSSINGEVIKLKVDDTNGLKFDGELRDIAYYEEDGSDSEWEEKDKNNFLQWNINFK